MDSNSWRGLFGSLPNPTCDWFRVLREGRRQSEKRSRRTSPAGASRSPQLGRRARDPEAFHHRPVVIDIFGDVREALAGQVLHVDHVGFVPGNCMLVNVPPSAACSPCRNGITGRVTLGSPIRSMTARSAGRGRRGRQLKGQRRRGGCRGHGYGDDQFVNNLGDTRRERRFSSDAIDPPLRLAAGAWIWRDPLQQTTRPD